MKQLPFKIEIKANAKTVWFALWDDDNYKKWTIAFCEGSYAVSNWNKGSKIHFLDPNGNGMYSIIDEKIEDQEMSFKHLGELKNYQEQTLDKNTELWSGCIEKYTLQEKNGITTLYVFIDTIDEFTSFFEKTIPQALVNIKQLSENMKITVSISTFVNIENVWNLFTGAEHIMHWNNASEDWHTPKVMNNLEVKGTFRYRMEAKDGSFGFDFEGIYTEVKKHQTIAYTMPDKRNVIIHFSVKENTTWVTEIFDPETTNSLELQKNGWQSILNNFKKYVESYKF